MWRCLSEQSGAGFWSASKQPKLVVDDLQRLLAEEGLLDAMSWKAREFALTHTFEREFDLRIDALNKVLEDLSAAAA